VLDERRWRHRRPGFQSCLGAISACRSSSGRRVGHRQVNIVHSRVLVRAALTRTCGSNTVGPATTSAAVSIGQRNGVADRLSRVRTQPWIPKAAL